MSANRRDRRLALFGPPRDPGVPTSQEEASDREYQGLKKALLWVGGVLATIGTAFQIAGVNSVPLANLVLIFGVWIFTGAEVWFSRRVKSWGLYRYSAIAGASCLAGCVAVLISGYISGLRTPPPSPIPAASSMSFMNLEKILFVKGHEKIEPGATLFIDVYNCQHGPEPLQKVIGLTSLVMVRNPGPDADFQAWATFNRDLPHYQAQLPGVSSSDVPLGGCQYPTTKLPIANQTEADAILSGKLRIYIFGWTTWTDYESRTSERKFCRWIQKPTSTILYPPETVILHGC
jgi:hypothetical protein